MSENKLKHLEFLQNTISRMSTNSFIVKGWCITLISAIFVLVDKNLYVLILPSILIFWYINAYFLSLERQFRTLYDEVRLKDEGEIDFSMNAEKFNNGRNTIFYSLFAKSIWPLYTSILLISIYLLFCNKCS